MNPETNRFEQLVNPEDAIKSPGEIGRMIKRAESTLLRPDGTPVPPHWPVFTVGELVVIKDYTFRVAYIGETAILFEPVRPEDALRPDPTP